MEVKVLGGVPCSRKRIILFLFLVFWVIAVVHAGGGSEEGFDEAVSLMRTGESGSPESIDNNAQAADILAQIVERVQARDPVSRRLSQLRLMLADAYYESRQYNKAISVLTTIMYSDVELFDEAEQRIAEIRDVRIRYNDLLNELLAELRKSDIRDPDNPFDEAEALAIISAMEDLFPIPDEGTREQIQSNKERVKLAVDRGYRDLIVDLAHELILDGEYTGAMARYLAIDDIDDRGFYQRSFELQLEEFLRQGLPQLYVDQVLETAARVEELVPAYSRDSQRLVEINPGYRAAVDRLFPVDGSLVAAQLFDDQTDLSPVLALDELLSEAAQLLGSHGSFRREMLQRAADFVELRNFLSDTDQDSNYLLFLQDFIAGPAEYEGEGIAGAATLEALRLHDAYLDPLWERLQEYVSQVDQTFEGALFADVASLYASSLVLAEFSMALAMLPEGEAPPTASASPDPGVLADWLVLLHPEDRAEAGLAVIALYHASGRNRLSALALQHEELLGRQFQETDPARASYLEALDILSTLETASQDQLELAAVLGEDLQGIQEQDDEQDENLLSGELARYVEIHQQDAQALTLSLRSTAANYFSRYLTLLQSDIPSVFVQAGQNIDEGRRLLEGIEERTRILGEEIVSIRYYPSRALDLFIPAREALNRVIGVSGQIRTEILTEPDWIRNSPEVSFLDESSRQLIEQAQSSLEELSSNISAAENRAALAASYLEDARILVQNFEDQVNQARSEQDRIDLEFLSEDIRSEYTNSLETDWIAEVDEEREQVLTGLTRELQEIIATISRNIYEQAIEDVDRILSDQSPDYFSARDRLNDAENAFARFNAEPDPGIEERRLRIERAIVLQGRRDIPPVSDSRYARISNDLNEAGKALERARTAASAGNEQQLNREIGIARSHIASVRTQLPSNPEAAFIELQLIQLEDPAGFDEYYSRILTEYLEAVYGQPRVSAALFGEGEYGSYDQVQKDELLTRISALQELRPDPRLQSMIVAVEVDLGLREDPAIAAARNEANRLTGIARTRIVQARNEIGVQRTRLLEDALALLETARNTFPVAQIPGLISEAEALLGITPTIVLPPAAQRLFDEAVAFRVNGNLTRAKTILDTLWSNSEYRTVYTLREEIVLVYNALRITPPTSL